MTYLYFLFIYLRYNFFDNSGGNDYHADNKPGTKLGIEKRNLNIPIDILDDWNIF